MEYRNLLVATLWQPRSCVKCCCGGLPSGTGLPVIAVIEFFLACSSRMAGMNAWMLAIAMGITMFHTVCSPGLAGAWRAIVRG